VERVEMSTETFERIVRNEDERRFRVNGYDFMVRPALSARRLAEFEDAYLGFLRNPDPVAVQQVDLMEGFIGECLEEEHRSAWEEATAADNPRPMSLDQLEKIVNHVVSSVSGRPFERPSASGGTSETTGTTSTDESPSQEES
jgi:hypothetical protein